MLKQNIKTDKENKYDNKTEVEKLKSSGNNQMTKLQVIIDSN